MRRFSRTYRQLEEQIWGVAGPLLSRKQQTDLHQLILNWERSNFRIHDVANIRLRNLDGIHLTALDDGMAARGLLGGLRKLLGSVKESLLYGERIMYVMEKTPVILSQQSDETIARVGESFPLPW